MLTLKCEAPSLNLDDLTGCKPNGSPDNVQQMPTGHIHADNLSFTLSRGKATVPLMVRVAAGLAMGRT